MHDCISLAGLANCAYIQPQIPTQPPQRSRTIASVTIRNLSEETKGLLSARASRRRHSLEEELRQILDEAARSEAANPDMLEPLGSFIVRLTRPGYDDVADAIEAQRRRADRPLPDFG